jgi:hypothetical protein
VEICAVELETKLFKSIILTLYRVPTGNFNQFIKNLDDALIHICNNKKDFFFCGDITHHFIEGNQNQQVASLLPTCNLLHTDNFATKIQNNSSIATDNIFVDNSRIYLSSSSPIKNNLSNNDSKINTIKIIYIYIYIFFFFLSDSAVKLQDDWL